MKTSWEDRQWWVWALCCLLLFAGYIAGATWPGRFASLLSPSLDQLRRLALQSGMFHSVFRTIGVIFVHNLFAALVVMVVSGIITAGIYPAWAMWMNGLTLGYVIATESHQLGVPEWRIFAFGVLPHGLFELPAFVWCGVLGIHLGYVAVQSVWYRLQTAVFRVQPAYDRSDGVFRREFRHTLRLLPYPIGLLLVAATIEGTITPHLLVSHIHHIPGAL
jgi:stage II sporulation protein M